MRRNSVSHLKKHQEVLLASIEYARTKEEPVMVLPEEDFFEHVCAGILDGEEAKVFKANFVLVEDLNNDDLKFSDKWVQRFNRPVQITARPWVLLRVVSIIQLRHYMRVG